MPKVSKSKQVKAKAFLSEFTGKFKVNPNNDLFCFSCNEVVNCEKRSVVLLHRQSAKHSHSSSSTSVRSTEQLFASSSSNHQKNDYADKIVTAFLSANIPLYTLNNPLLRQLLEKSGEKLPSESTCRRRVSHLAEQERISVSYTHLTLPTIYSV